MDQGEIILRLSRGEGLGNTPPERLDTHISVIFLVGDDAYKLKRATITSYLDYSTLEKRRRYCLAELAINRRTAPELYLDVVPVRLAGDGTLAIGEGPGEPIEWLVHMRRFAQDSLLDRMAEDGRLTPAIILDLADRIAAFHGEAEKMVDPGASRRIAFVVEENAGELRRHGSSLSGGAAADELDRRCRSAFDRQRSRIDHRGARGFVRHCHGDLHLRNICLVDGKPTLFDAIEFSDAISHIDVLYDLAFLLMDLEHRGLRVHANLLFNRYLYRTGDVDDLSVLPLYLALRAGIRTHVSAMAGGLAQDRGQRDALLRRAGDYLRLGVDLLERRPPVLIAIGGLSGTGKSSVARAIAPRLGAAPGALVLSSDPIRKQLLGQEPLTRLGADAYRPEVDRMVYDKMMDTARRALEGGQAVVLDATFQDPACRRAAEALARSVGVPFEGVWLQASVAQLYARLAARSGDPSDATAPVLARQLERELGDVTWRRFDADAALETVVSEIQTALRRQGTMSRDGENPDMRRAASMP